MTNESLVLDIDEELGRIRGTLCRTESHIKMSSYYEVVCLSCAYLPKEERVAMWDKLSKKGIFPNQKRKPAYPKKRGVSGANYTFPQTPTWGSEPGMAQGYRSNFNNYAPSDVIVYSPEYATPSSGFYKPMKSGSEPTIPPEEAKMMADEMDKLFGAPKTVLDKTPGQYTNLNNGDTYKQIEDAKDT